MNSARRGFTIGSTLAAAIIFLGGLATRGADTPRKPASDPPRLSAAERLVRQALAAEFSGDNARRDELLAQALQEDPNCRPARWQSGFVSLDDYWLTPEQASQKFSSDRALAEYRRRRDAAADAGLFARGNVLASVGSINGSLRSSQSTTAESFRSAAFSPEGISAHAELARWCGMKRLADEARAHWTQVLLERPDNHEAEARLGLRWFNGGLYTNTQIDAMKKQRAIEGKQWSDWKATVLRWRSALDGSSESVQGQMVREMQEVKDPSIIPALEWASVFDAPKPPANRDAASPFQRAAVALLGRIPAQRATLSLVGHAVFPPQAEVREVATLELKKRKLHDFVPILLAGLANPIDLRQSASFAGDGLFNSIAYEGVLSQEDHDKERVVLYSDSASGKPSETNVIWYFNRRPQKFERLLSPGFDAPAKAAALNRDLRESRSLENGVERKNEQINSLNARIASVLKTVANDAAVSMISENDSDVIPDTSVIGSSGSTANYWWTWWDNYNERYVAYAKPLQVTLYSTAMNYPNLSVTMNPSCFSAGTKVTTTCGLASIEKLQIGDRVLAQDADSGELAFKPVLGTTVRPPVEMVLVTTTRGELRTTRGHPFWIVGKGWRMAKELQVGDRLVSLGGSATVTALAKQPPEPAYNMIVADFGTYFVGDGRILVHDNTPRLPTPADIPGYIADAR